MSLFVCVSVHRPRPSEVPKASTSDNVKEVKPASVGTKRKKSVPGSATAAKRVKMEPFAPEVTHVRT